jgi:hypothetical protein
VKATVSMGLDGFVQNNNGHVEIARQKSPTGVNFETGYLAVTCEGGSLHTHTHDDKVESETDVRYFSGKYAKTCCAEYGANS